jgi:nardilysin
VFSGEGSLISYLRKKVWALSLTAGNHGDGVEFNTTCSLFAITIVLTKAGHEHIREVTVNM